ncbi:MAG: beta-class carbonic anhydrase [Thermocrispum sp.]
MSGTDDLVRRHLDGVDHGAPEIQTPVPSLHVAIVTCMDARIKVFDVFGLRHGEAHILRNAGGVATDDMIRSLTISQRKLQTREIIIMQHTQCGLSMITEDSFKDEVQAETGLRPPWSIESFREVKDSVQQTLRRIRSSPFIPYRDNVRGFVYDVNTADLTEVIA